MMDEAGFLAALAPLRGPKMIERSAKLTGERLASGRLLVSAPRRALLPGAERTFRTICEALGAPDIAPLVRHLPQAAEVHFGFEPGARPVAKAYLEFGPDGPVPHLRFLALKWREGRARTNLYFDRTALRPEARADLITEVIPDGRERDLMLALVAAATTAAPLDDLPLLLVEEEGTGRRSLDLNIADLDWGVAEISDLPQTLRGAVGDARIGHVAAGVDGEGEAFLTVYHGAARWV
ncbi:hypothetical protein [Roseobacter sp. HKCCA0434]|uniref:hypothetical protein n=1 Tax=Roseobacter sp. HKCCA0434 TaxID=3079297 RepID=UPI0029058809|nr:hypothetical protein [Roseobacter sp. HKCCA0434]